MEELLTKGALKEGFFALLFISLLIYQIRENRYHLNKAEERENKLISFLDEMKEQYAALTRHYERLSEDVAVLKDRLDRR